MSLTSKTTYDFEDGSFRLRYIPTMATTIRFVWILANSSVNGTKYTPHVALWVYAQQNTKCLFGCLYLIDLHSPCVHIYSMSLETKSLLQCLLCITLSRHYIGKIHEHSLTTQHR